MISDKSSVEIDDRGTTTSPASLRVLVVDDSSVVRKTLTRVLEGDALIQVVGTACDGPEAVEMS